MLFNTWKIVLASQLWRTWNGVCSGRDGERLWWNFILYWEWAKKRWSFCPSL